MNDGGTRGEPARAALGALFGAALVLRILWTGTTYPESDVFILLALSALLALALLFAACSPSASWRVAPPDLCVLLFFCVVLARARYSPQWWQARDVVFQAAACTAGYFLAAALAAARRARIAVCTGLLAGVLLAALYGLYQYYWGLGETRAMLAAAAQGADKNSALLSRVFSNAIFSTFYFPNALAGYLIVIIPFAASIFFWPREDSLAAALGGYLCVILGAVLACAFFSDLAAKPGLFAGLFAAAASCAAGLAFAEKMKGRLLLNLLCVPFALLPLWALSLTASEGAWGALAVAAAVAVPALLGRKKLATLIAAALAAAVVAVLAAGHLPSGPRESLGARAGYWRVALEMWRSRPLAGAGPGSFASEYARLRAPSSEEGRMVHSIYLGLAAETGLAGVAAFLCMWAACLGTLIKSQIPNPKSQTEQEQNKSQIPNPKSQKEQEQNKSQIPYPKSQSEEKKGAGRAIAFAAAVGICAFLLHGIGDVGMTISATTLTLWTLAGLGVGCAAPPAARRLPPAACAALALLVLSAAALWVVPRAAAEACRIAAARREREGRVDRAAGLLGRAAALDGGNPAYWYECGGVLERSRRDAEARRAYLRAVAAGGGSAAQYFRLAACSWNLSKGGADASLAAAARLSLRKAIERNPQDADYRMLLAFWMEKDGRTADALLEYRRAREIIGASLSAPKRIRRHTPAALARLDEMLKERIAELEQRNK